VSTGFERLRAYEASLDALKLSLDDSLIALASAFSEEEGERCAEELLVKNRPFTALVCANDRLAIGAIAALQRHGVICPDDVSVTGLHDMPFASRLQPPPTTIRIQHNKAGTEAAEVMVQLLESPLSEKARHIVLPTELIIRQSTKAVRAGELDGSEAHQTPPIEQSSKAAALSGRRKGRG
jgi:LacI family transcriptional regulator